MKEIKLKVVNNKGVVIGYEVWNSGFGWHHTIESDELEEDGTRRIRNGVLERAFDCDIRLQYTGILDKNKEEVYDKDKLKNNSTIFAVEWNQQNGCWWLSPQSAIIPEENVQDDWILLQLENQKLGNGYYRREDLELIK